MVAVAVMKRKRVNPELATAAGLKKRKLENGESKLGFATALEKQVFNINAKVKRTKVTSKNAYLDQRCDNCHGKTVQECLKLTYRKPTGQKTQYTLADLRYVVKGKLLEVVGGTSKAEKNKAPVVSGKKVPALDAVKNPACAASVHGGVRLASGAIMPVVGFGTYKLKNHEVGKPVLSALKAGYRLIDTAQVYENEKGVGEALRNSGLARSDVFIETKVWRSSHGYDRTMKAFNQSLRNLGVDYIDLYVIHWPGCKTGWPLKRGTMCPPDWTPAMRDTGTYRAMEDLYKIGKVKAIGVTNYSVRHLKQLLKRCRVKPMVNQFEFHPRLVQSDLLDFCRKHGIAAQAYASLGSGDAGQAESFFAFPPVCAAAKAHKVTPAQVLLRWAVQKGCHVVPKSVREERVAENKGIFNFKLSAGEMKAIDKLHNGTRFAWKGLDPDSIK